MILCILKEHGKQSKEFLRMWSFNIPTIVFPYIRRTFIYYASTFFEFNFKTNFERYKKRNDNSSFQTLHIEESEYNLWPSVDNAYNSESFQVRIIQEGITALHTLS